MIANFKKCRWLLASVLAMVLFVPAAQAAKPEDINAAIKKAVEFLYSSQNEHGNWETTQIDPNGGSGHESQWGGRTALVTYALLAAGEKPLDPRIVKATDWLRKSTINGHYALGVRANVWLNLPPTPANQEALVKDMRLLTTGITKAGVAKGFYNYRPGPSSRIDLSCSQYGVLGSWAGAQRIENVPPAFWTLIENAWRGVQASDGGWAYAGKPDKNHNVTLQMVAAGVATLFITQEFLHSDEGIEGNKGNIVDPWINKGLAWVEKNFADFMKRPIPYGMYGIERIGVASGYKYFGKIDWFQEGADHFVKTQRRGTGGWGDEVNTSFGLLFLSRGRAPVMINKLQYSITDPKTNKAVEANWNQRPRDIANATRWVENRTERGLNWQIINLGVATIADLHDSALLYISGNQTLSFTDAEKQMLKQYVEEGGIIVGNADVAKAEFVKSFRALAGELFPEQEFTQLQDRMEHPLLINQQFNATTWKQKPRIEALGNRARLFMVLISNDDFSRTLQLRDTNKPEVFEFFANAFLYANDKTQGKYKGETHIIRADPAIKPATTTKVARLKYNGRWDPEPGGWKRLAAVMNNQDKVTLQTAVVELGKDSLADYKIAHMTGTDQFVLSDAQRTALKDFIAAGGLLVIDAAGGFGEFDSSMQAELMKILPNEFAQISSSLKSDHALYTADAASKIEPKYRIYAQQKLGADSLRFRIRGIEVGGKLAVLYSPDDLSVGLVGNEIDGVIGYSPDLATTLMRRILTLRTAGKL